NLFVALLEGLRAHGGEPAQLYEALRAIDARARMGGRAPTEIETKLIEAPGEPRARIGSARATDVQLIAPVLAGATNAHRAPLTHVLANAKRFDVEARVDDRAVARGSITSATPGR